MSDLADALGELATCESSFGQYAGRREHLTTDDIARQAYCLYEMRGRRDGHHIEDWLLAERELTQGPMISDFIVTSRLNGRS